MPPWLLETAIIFFIVFFIFCSLYLVFEINYKNKAYPGIRAGNINLSGKSKEQIEQLINYQTDKIRQEGINFYYNGAKINIQPLISSPEGDLAYEIIGFDTKKTAENIMNYGRADNFFINLKNKISLFIWEKKVPVIFTINEERLKKILSDNFSPYLAPAQDAKLIYAPTDNKKIYKFIIEEEKAGKDINYQKGLNVLSQNLSQLNFSPIYLVSENIKPLVAKNDCLNIESRAENLLNLAPLAIAYPSDLPATSTLKTREGKQWLIAKKDFADWLKIKSGAENKTAVGLDEEKIKEYFLNLIIPEVNKPPKNAKFSLKNGRVVEFQQSGDGVEVNLEKTIKLAEEKIIEKGENKIELALNIILGSIKPEEINNLGIKEIIGIGESNFSGSPKNRRHNIAVGANAMHGVLIKPGEEFSLLGALGKIEASTGYLPELVIKENKTAPEYGGGLCQIGTTIFRSALASGLPITARRNHSYRVAYYEPAGTDATIYSPAPDLKFTNDTVSHILIQSRIEKDNLFFEFWGTKDGRRATQTKSIIYNIVKPGPTKIIESLDLKPGEKKCTEKAHNGADAYFDYIVFYPNGEKKEKRFSSHYVPWRAVCLIGVEKLSTNNFSNIATGTLINTNSGATTSAADSGE